MHLRSSQVFLVASFLIFLATSASPQSPPPAGEAFPSGIAQPAAAKQQPAQPDPPKPDLEKQNPPKQGTAAPAADSQQDQSAQEDQGGFRFHTSVEEVVLHATVVDDKQRMSQ